MSITVSQVEQKGVTSRVRSHLAPAVVAGAVALEVGLLRQCDVRGLAEAEETERVGDVQLRVLTVGALALAGGGEALSRGDRIDLLCVDAAVERGALRQGREELELCLPRGALRGGGEGLRQSDQARQHRHKPCDVRSVNTSTSVRTDPRITSNRQIVQSAELTRGSTGSWCVRSGPCTGRSREPARGTYPSCPRCPSSGNADGTPPRHRTPGSHRQPVKARPNNRKQAVGFDPSITSNGRLLV